MRKIMLVITSVLMFTMLFGCASKDVSKEPESTPTPTPEATEEVENVDCSTLIPDPKDIFSDGDIITNITSTQCYYRVENYKDGEYEAYVDAVKEMGFDNIHYQGENDGGKMYMAYDKDKNYYLEVFLGNEINAIDIICKVVTKK